jgi:hypothetical protein
MVLWVIVTYIWGARVFNFIDDLMSFTELHIRVQVTWFLYRHFPIYAVVSEGPAQVGIQYTYGQMYMRIKGSLGDNHAPAHWNPIGCSVNAVPPVLSPSSIFLLPFHYTFNTERKNLAQVLKIAFFSAS